VKAGAEAQQDAAQLVVLSGAETTERERELSGATGFASFAERDLEVAAAFGAFGERAGAEIRQRADDCALELRPAAAHELSQLRLARIDEDRGSFRELIGDKPFVREVPIEGV
jgi:hypothetical protein